MNIKERILELLHSLEQLYSKVESCLDDSEKDKYLPKIREHQDFISRTTVRINTSELSIEELVRIHSEILNKYFS
jgi:hypothetical protein